MTLSFYILAFAILFIIVDLLFARTCHLTVVALVGLFFDLQVNIRIHWLVRVFMTVFMIFFIYQFYDKIWNLILKKWPLKDKYQAGVYGLVGKTGTVKILDGKKSACINGDLYSFSKENSLKEGDSFVVKDIVDGKILI